MSFQASLSTRARFMFSHRLNSKPSFFLGQQRSFQAFRSKNWLFSGFVPYQNFLTILSKLLVTLFGAINVALNHRPDKSGFARSGQKLALPPFSLACTLYFFSFPYSFNIILPKPMHYLDTWLRHLYPSDHAHFSSYSSHSFKYCYKKRILDLSIFID